MSEPIIDRSAEKFASLSCSDMQGAILQWIDGLHPIGANVWTQGGRIYISLVFGPGEIGRGNRTLVFNGVASVTRAHSQGLSLPGPAVPLI